MITQLLLTLACLSPKSDSRVVDSAPRADSANTSESAACCDSAVSTESVGSLDSTPRADSGDTSAPPPPASMLTVLIDGSTGGIGLATDGALVGWCCSAWDPIPWSAGWEDVFRASDYAICGRHSGLAVCGEQPGFDGVWTAITPPTPDDPTLVPDDWWDSWVRVAGYDSEYGQSGCALTDSGGLYCWESIYGAYLVVESGVTDFSMGDDPWFFWIQDGAVGFQDATGRLPADSFPSLAGEAVDVEASDSHTCALMADGTIQCNDADLEALYGDDLPDQGTIPTGTFTQISIGYYVNCGVRTDGTLACWGNLDGAIYPYPNSSLADVPDGIYTQVSVSNYLGCAVRTDGCVVCWSVDFRYEPDLIGYNPTVADPLCYSGQALTLGE